MEDWLGGLDSHGGGSMADGERRIVVDDGEGRTSSFPFIGRGQQLEGE